MPIFTSENVTGLSMEVFVGPSKVFLPGQMPLQLTMVRCKLECGAAPVEPTLLILPVPLKTAKLHAILMSLDQQQKQYDVFDILGRAFKVEPLEATCPAEASLETDPPVNKTSPRSHETLPSPGETVRRFEYFVAQNYGGLKEVEIQSGVKFPLETKQSLKKTYSKGFAFAVCKFTEPGYYTPFWMMHERGTDGRFYVPVDHSSNLTVYVWGSAERWPANVNGDSQEQVFKSYELVEDYAAGELFMFQDVDEDVTGVAPFSHTVLSMNKNNVSCWTLKQGLMLLGDLTVISADTLATHPRCTFPLSKKENHLVQPVFYCYTCAVAGDRGVCTKCAISCHANKGHQVIFALCESSYCDCGCTVQEITSTNLPGKEAHANGIANPNANGKPPVNKDPGFRAQDKTKEAESHKFSHLMKTLLTEPSKRGELVSNPKNLYDKASKKK